MMAVIGTMVFLGAMAFAVAAMWLTIAPQWRRVRDLAMGRVEQPFRPLATLALAERRIAVRRWAAAPNSGQARTRVAA